MTNTSLSFRDKWFENPSLAFADTLREGSDTQRWILGRNGFASPDAARAHLAGRRRLLDAGCGNGRVTALLRRLAAPDAEVVGVDLVAAPVASANLAGLPGVEIRPADLLGDLAPLGQFDFVYCQEVLHHTGRPRDAFLNVANRVAPGGEYAVYVYRKKAPVREFVDDYVRDRIATLPYAEASAACAEITAFGRALTELGGGGVQITVPAVSVLGIEAGTYDVQRLVYHFFMKCYWNPDLTEAENVAINYDWYHPQDCTRHELPEVLEWFTAAGLTLVHQHVDPYGITVRGVRPSA